MSAMRYAASRIGKTAAATRRQQQSSSHRSHPRPAAQRTPEPTLGPYNIWEYGEEGNYWPAPKWIKSFSSAEERNAYLSAKRAAREEEERRIAEHWRRVDEQRARRYAEEARLTELQRAEEARLAEQQRIEAARAAEERRAADAAENEATAQMGCLGRSCKRALQWVQGTHTLRGVRKPSTNGGRRHRAVATRRRQRKN